MQQSMQQQVVVHQSASMYWQSESGLGVRWPAAIAAAVLVVHSASKQAVVRAMCLQMSLP
jgi:hypothetical protein